MPLSTDIESARQMMVEGRDVPWLLNQWATRTPDKTFLTWEPFDGKSRRWTYAQMQNEVRAVAAALYQHGVRSGDKVLIHLDNSPEFIISWFACAELGAVALSTNTRSVARDMIYFAEHAGVVCAITQPSFAQLVAESAPHIKFLAITDNNAGEPANIEETITHIPFAELLAETAPYPERPTEAMADLSIQYTSGTTSRPKAVLWTHANAIWGAQVNAMHCRLVHDDVSLVFLPLFHTNAQSYSMLGSLWVGGTMVLQPKFSASRFWPISLKHRCTWASLIYFCIKTLMEHPIPKKHHYKFWGPAVSLPSVDAEFSVRTFGWWGMTETITHGIVGDLDHPGPQFCIGRAAMGYDISIRRPDGSDIAPGERGALYIRGVRGVTLFKEYYKNPEATEKSFDSDGWFDTGDLIRMDEQGDLFFGDRDKDMLKVGAENVAASEVEAVIIETGWVKECAVVGQKHAMLDEVPVAFVIPADDAPSPLKELIITACRENLADFKVVRDVHIVDELPRSMLEKVAKNKLRERLPDIEGDLLEI